MDPNAARRQLDERLAALRRSGSHPPLEVVEAQVQRTARAIQSDAARRRQQVTARVRRVGNSVRLEVTGPQAAQYERQARQQLESSKDEVGRELRARLTQELGG